MFKKALSLLSAGAVMSVTLLQGLQGVSAATNDPEFAKALSWMNQSGYTMYSTEDGFRPFSNLRRDEAAKFISTFATTVLSGCRQYQVQGCDFADASDINPSLTSSVKTACEYGLMIGSVSNGARYFYPTANVTKAQFVTTMVRAYEGLKDENGNPWFANYYNSALSRGIISLVANPTAMVLDKPLTRYEAALMLYRSSSMGCTTGMMNTGMMNTGVVATGNTVLNGNVSISLAANSNPGTLGTIFIPRTSKNNRVMSVDVVATNGSARLNTITLSLDDSLFDRNTAMVSLTDENGVKLTNTRSFNSSNEAILTFTSPFMVDSRVRNLTVNFDVSGSVNQRTIVSVKTATTSSGSVAVSSSVMSKYINTVDISSSANKITLTTVGGGTNPVSCNTSSNFVFIGETNKLLGRFNLDYTSNNNKSALVTSIRFRSSKSLNGIVSNLKLVVGTGTASTEAIIDNRYVTFVFGSGGYVMNYGQSRSFYIYGDVVGGQANDAIELYVENDGDVAAYENTASMVALNTVRSPTSFYTQLYCIKEGSNTITRIDGLSATNIPTREQLIQGLVANVNTKSSIKVDKIKLYVSDTNALNINVDAQKDIENVRLYINGVLVDSLSNTMGPVGAQYYEIGAYRDLNAGANTVEVRFDTRSDAATGNTIRFTLDPSSFVYGGNAVYNVSQNNVMISDFNGSAIGARLIIRNAGVDNISLTDSATNLTRVKESDDFGAIQFGIRPNNVRDIILNGFKLNINSFDGVVGSNNVNFVTDATVVVDGKEIQTVSFSQGLSATFNSLGIVIPRNSNKNIYVKVKTTSTHPDSAVNDVRYSVSAFDIQDVNSNSINTINGVPTATYTLLGRQLDVAPAISISCSVQSVGNVGSVTTNTSGTIVASYKFTSNFGASSLRELAIANVTVAGSTVSPDSTLVNSYNATNLSPNFDNSADGTVLMAFVNGDKLGEATLLNGIAYITNINGGIGYTIPTNGSLNITIRAVASSNVNNGVLRLRMISPNLNTTAFLEGSAQTLISALNSNSNVVGSCTSATSAPAYIRRSSLTVAVNASTSLIKPVLNVGDDVFVTRLTADAANPIIIKRLTFNVNETLATNPTATNFALRVNGIRYNNVNEAACIYNGTNSVTCVFINSYDEGITIPAGGTTEFRLSVENTPIAISSNEVISFNISQQSSDGAAYSYASVPNPTSIVWSDSSVVGHSLTTTDRYTDRSLTIESFSQSYYRN